MEETTTPPAVTRVALIAIGNKDAAQLWMMIDRFMAEEFAIGVSANADIAVLDADAHGFQEAFRDWRTGHPGAPAIVFTSNPAPQIHDVAYVRKPLNVSEMITVLGRVGSRVRNDRNLSNGIVSVEVCMDTDPGQVLDSIGITTDIGAGFHSTRASAARAPTNHEAP
jgi:hypothetical protein